MALQRRTRKTSASAQKALPEKAATQTIDAETTELATEVKTVTAEAVSNDDRLLQDEIDTARGASKEIDEPLSRDERSRLMYLEAQIDDAKFAIMEALQEINEKRLYRETHPSFEDYVKDRFAFTPRHAYHFIEAGKALNVLRNSERDVQPGAITEYQLRPLTRLKSEKEIVDAWDEAFRISEGKTPTHDTMALAVRKIKGLDQDEAQVQEQFDPGDIVKVSFKGNSSLKRYDGQWAVVLDVVGENLYDIAVYEKDIPDVSSRELEAMPFSFTKRQREDRQKLLTTLRAIHKNGSKEDLLDRIVHYFARLDRNYETGFERDILKVVKGQIAPQTTKINPAEGKENTETRLEQAV